MQSAKRLVICFMTHRVLSAKPEYYFSAVEKTPVGISRLFC
jgi:hypothetical protein